MIFYSVFWTYLFWSSLGYATVYCLLSRRASTTGQPRIAGLYFCVLRGCVNFSFGSWEVAWFSALDLERFSDFLRSYGNSYLPGVLCFEAFWTLLQCAFFWAFWTRLQCTLFRHCRSVTICSGSGSCLLCPALTSKHSLVKIRAAGWLNLFWAFPGKYDNYNNNNDPDQQHRLFLQLSGSGMIYFGSGPLLVCPALIF